MWWPETQSCPLLAGESMWGVERGARGGNHDTPFARRLDCCLDSLDGTLEVGLPDVATIDHTSGKNRLRA